MHEPGEPSRYSLVPSSKRQRIGIAHPQYLPPVAEHNRCRCAAHRHAAAQGASGAGAGDYWDCKVPARGQSGSISKSSPAWAMCSSGNSVQYCSLPRPPPRGCSPPRSATSQAPSWAWPPPPPPLPLRTNLSPTASTTAPDSPAASATPPSPSTAPPKTAPHLVLPRLPARRPGTHALFRLSGSGDDAALHRAGFPHNNTPRIISTNPANNTSQPHSRRNIRPGSRPGAPESASPQRNKYARQPNQRHGNHARSPVHIQLTTNNH